MVINFDKVYERDIDMYVISNFCNSSIFLSLFLDRINKKGYKVYSTEVSLADENGESDITVVIEKGNHKIGLLIEDKIDALAMPNQSGRYYIRGDKGVVDGKYNEYYVFIIAPQDYLDSNPEAQKYPNKISYEQLLEVVEDEYGKALFKSAIEKKKCGYVVIENKETTKFWKDYYDFVDKFYPQIEIPRVEGPRGSSEGWVHIKTDDKRVYIMHKSDRGYLDMTFNGLGRYYNDFRNYMDNYLEEEMTIHRTGKSMAIRIIIPKVSFHSGFEMYQNEMKMIMEKVLKMLKFMRKIDIDDLYNKIMIE